MDSKRSSCRLVANFGLRSHECNLHVYLNVELRSMWGAFKGQLFGCLSREDTQLGC